MKVVIIGSGKIVRRILKEFKNEVQVYGIYSRNLNSAKDIAIKTGAIVFKTLDAILRHKEQFDFVYIATPHTSHFEYASWCLKNNINVLVEKPIVTEVKNMEELIELSKIHNSFIAEAMWSFICEPLNTLKEYLKDKKIEEANLSFSIFRPRFDTSDRLYKKELKGGALFDIGIYLVTMAYMFFGKPKDIKIGENTLVKDGIDVKDTIYFIYDDFKVTLFTSFYGINDSLYIKGKDFEVKASSSHHPHKIKIKDEEGVKYIKGVTSYLNEFKYIFNDINNGLKNSSTYPLSNSLEVIKLLEEINSKINEHVSTL